jgi:hypothetical protein
MCSVRTGLTSRWIIATLAVLLLAHAPGAAAVDIGKRRADIVSVGSEAAVKVSVRGGAQWRLGCYVIQAAEARIGGVVRGW